MKKASGKFYIYSLVNPIDDKVFYVGRSKNVYVRVLEHINKSHLKKTPKDEVLSMLFSKGLFPKYEVLEELEYKEGDKTFSVLLGERERHWIEVYSNLGWVSNKQKNKSRIDSEYAETITCLYCGAMAQAMKKGKKFCSDLHRVYYNRDSKKEKPKEVSGSVKSKLENLVNLPYIKPKSLNQKKEEPIDHEQAFMEKIIGCETVWDAEKIHKDILACKYLSGAVRSILLAELKKQSKDFYNE
jgi:predicted GIY-YIG superfamily endonuclease